MDKSHNLRFFMHADRIEGAANRSQPMGWRRAALAPVRSEIQKNATCIDSRYPDIATHRTLF